MAETGHVINVGNLKKAVVFATGWAGNYQSGRCQATRFGKRAIGFGYEICGWRSKTAFFLSFS